jgi:carboxyl-terminal processing protease
MGMEPSTMKSIGYIFLLFGSIGQTFAQRNLSFEETLDSSRTTPAYWFTAGKGYQGVVDSTTAQQGSRSLRMFRREPGAFGVAKQIIAADSFVGSFLTFTGWIKTQTVSDGYCGLWLRLDAANNKMAYLDNMNDREIIGTTPWTRYEIKTFVSPDVQYIAFGAMLTGNGTAWFDSFELRPSLAEERPPSSGVALSYLNRALDSMEMNSIKRDSINWKTLRATIISRSRGAQEIKDTYQHIRYALALLGDNHSSLMTKEQTQAWESGQDRSGMDAAIRSELIRPRFAYISIPTFASGKDSAIRAFATHIHRTIATLDSSKPCGWIVDLRDDGGGNMWPMIAGLGPLLGETQLGASVDRHGNRKSWWYKEGKSGEGDVTLARITGHACRLRSGNPPVAVLTGKNTASSGEAVVISFRGRPDTKSFGGATKGLSTSNETFPLIDGAMMVLTTSVFADRTGRLYGSVIEPDEVIQTGPSTDLSIDPVVQAALSWLRMQRSCQEQPSP